MKWRLIKTIEASGAMQMALDEAMLTARIKGIVPNTLRFFSWNPAAITIGFFQGLEKEVDVKKAKRFGIDVVRRYTGGGAVLHEHELTYSLAVSEKEIQGDIISSYNKLCSGIILGLKEMGLNAEFKPVNDIIVNGKKISGNGQTRKNGVILQHGTVLLDVDLEKMFSVLRVPDEKIKDKLITAASERVTSLKKELNRTVTMKETENALIKGFEKSMKIELKQGNFTEFEKNLAEKLCIEKYSNEKWTGMR